MQFMLINQVTGLVGLVRLNHLLSFGFSPSSSVPLWPMVLSGGRPVSIGIWEDDDTRVLGEGH